METKQHKHMMVNEGAIEICVAEGGEGKWKKLKENSRKINLSEFPLTSQVIFDILHLGGGGKEQRC